MKALLAYKVNPEGANDPFTSLLPVGLLSLHGVALRLGHQATLANLSQTGWPKVRALLAELKPRLVAISQFTHNRHESLRIAALAKELDPGCFTVLGGPHATHTYEETLSGNRSVDCVVIGEGEATFPELLRAVEEGTPLSAVAGLAYREGGVVRLSPPRDPIADLDSLPFPGEVAGPSLGVDYQRQLEFIISSRGCPASCLFCSSPLFWRRGVRFRSPESIVREIRFVRDTHGLIYFSFRDDTFTANRKRVLDLCRLLQEERLHIAWTCQSRVNAVDEEMLIAMKRAGCECIQFGVESGSPAMLKALGKRIAPADVERAAAAVRRVGINLSVYLITGIPGEGEGELKESVRLLERIKAQDGQVSPLVYYPGTELFDAAVRDGSAPANLFAASKGDGFPVRTDPFVERARQLMLRTIERGGGRGRFTETDFAAQQKLAGYSFVTQMLLGELREEAGDVAGALQAYREIVRREPENPWGWVLCAGLQAQCGDFHQARKGFREVLRLVPKHLPAVEALAEIDSIIGPETHGGSGRPGGGTKKRGSR